MMHNFQYPQKQKVVTPPNVALTEVVVYKEKEYVVTNLNYQGSDCLRLIKLEDGVLSNEELTLSPSDVQRYTPPEFFPTKKDPITEVIKRGSPFLEKAEEIAKIVEEKNKSYGNSQDKSAEFFKLLYPHAILPDHYKNVLLMARMFDKMMRIANRQEGFQGEDAKADLLGYALLLATGDNKK